MKNYISTKLENINFLTRNFQFEKIEKTFGSNENEIISFIGQQKHQGKYKWAAYALTNHRLIWASGIADNVTSVQFKNINNVELKQKLTGILVLINTLAGAVEIKFIDIKSATRLVDELNECLNSPLETVDVSSSTPIDKYEELKKLKELLDLDIISQSEFDKKKQELL